MFAPNVLMKSLTALTAPVRKRRTRRATRAANETTRRPRQWFRLSVSLAAIDPNPRNWITVHRGARSFRFSIAGTAELMAALAIAVFSNQPWVQKLILLALKHLGG